MTTGISVYGSLLVSQITSIISRQTGKLLKDKFWSFEQAGKACGMQSIPIAILLNGNDKKD
ncbi:hypothetical protein HPT25_22965 [Bacillus sp. BRMEA1]|uniref:hypothetical protein n=1 Tax=Neobacillus endophyticus TaxID=2738405 RepID=UPI0015645D8F|nr:hypothetical protein [Neobacillus endophyticus]NRD80197.1 hypothetical protein [Neobacillus endophyticus]